MPKRGNHWEQTVTDALSQLPPEAREAAADLALQLDAAGRERLEEIAVAVRRRNQRRESDRITDKNRRTLVGAHVPRKKADFYKELADEKDMSLHKWVYYALEEKAARQRGYIRLD